MEVLHEIDRIATHEMFAFIVSKQQTFKWNPSGVFKGALRFVVEIFDYERGNVVFPDNPDESEYVEIYVQEKDRAYKYLGKVYLKRLFTIETFSDFHNIRIINHYGKNMMVQIGLESTNFVPEKALDDDALKLPA